jgi:hypothetical protein
MISRIPCPPRADAVTGTHYCTAEDVSRGKKDAKYPK